MEINGWQSAIIRHLKQSARRLEAAERRNDAPANAQLDTWRAYEKLDQYIEELKEQGFEIH
jgi:hypothetical protein